jgi:hypothetical protein
MRDQVTVRTLANLLGVQDGTRARPKQKSQ